MPVSPRRIAAQLRSFVPLRRVPALLVLILGAAFSLAGFRALQAFEERRLQSRFERLAGDRIAAVQRTVAVNLEALHSLQSFYAASKLVERDEFAKFTRAPLARHPAIVALLWAPRVEGTEREAHEARARAAGLGDYRVLERDAAGAVVPARPRSEYFPVQYAAPSQGHAWPLGLDLASNATFSRVIVQARREEELVATGRLILEAPAPNATGIAVFASIHRPEPSGEVPSSKKAQFQGIIVGLFRLEQLLREALEPLPPGGLRVALLDDTAPPHRQLLATYPGVLSAAVGAGVHPSGILRRSETVDVGGRPWSVACAPDEQFLASEREWLPWAALASGLVVTLLLSGYLLVMVGRAARIERLVERRTDELSAANRDLREEMDRRLSVEQRLRESEERFRGLVETTSDWVWEVNAELVYTYVSPRVRDLLGYEPEEVVGRRPFDFMPRDEARRIERQFEPLAAAHAPFSGLENLGRHKDGHLVVLESSGVPFFGESGEFLGYRGVDRDITARKRAEEDLRKAGERLEERVRERTAQLDEAVSALRDEIEERQRAQEALRKAHDELEERVKERTAELARSNAELEQFAYVASHDLQEPLRMVSSYVQLLAERYKDRLDEDADEFIQYAVDGAERMRRLINDLLAYSRLETRAEPLVPTDAKAALDAALQNLEAAIQESGAAVSHGPLPTVLADRTQLVQLFQNLVGNAIKFRGQTPPEVRVMAEDQRQVWRFAVQDNGIGMDATQAERVFRIFQRLHTREEYPGTGIGLALCKRIVERHGGMIWVESQPGEGSTFFFTLAKEPPGAAGGKIAETDDPGPLSRERS
jgi:PAS domain S-box-containing protein